MSDLLPCPFCGGKPVVQDGKKGHCQLHGDPFQGMRIYCKTNGCPAHAGLERGDIYNGGKEKAREEAIAAWNRRAVTPAPVTLAAALALPEVKALMEAAWDGHQALVDAAEEIAELRSTLSKSDFELPWIGDAIDKICLARTALSKAKEEDTPNA